MTTKTKATKGVTATAVGRHLDLSRQRIVQLVDEGIMTNKTDGSFSLDESRIAYIRWLRSEDRRASRSAAASRKEDARTREIELRIAEKEHRLIDIEEHDAVLDEILAIVRGEVAMLPAQFTRDPAKRRELEDKVNATFERASTRLAQRGEELRANGEISETVADH